VNGIQTAAEVFLLQKIKKASDVSLARNCWYFVIADSQEINRGSFCGFPG
jgi:hypothetical protein